MSGPLLPAEHLVYPFKDSSHMLDTPDGLRLVAAEQGYLYFAEFLPQSLLAPVREFTREAFAELGWVEADPENQPVMRAISGAKLSGRGWDDRNWVEFQQRFSSDPSLLALAESPRVMAVLEAIVGEPAWRATVNFCWIKLPGCPEQTTLPHQDEWYLPGCPTMWTMWFPLVDTPFEVGPLGVVPGSNRSGVMEHGSAFTGLEVDPDVAWDSSEVRVGDVVFFSARTIHCAWSNVSDQWARVSADIRYEPRSIGNDSKLRNIQK